MIIVKFYGGLGNQMLQYANYTALQQRYPDARVMAEIRKYNYSKVHNGLELEQVFPIHLNVLFKNGIESVSGIKRYWHFALHKAIILFFKIGLKRFRFVKDNNVFNSDLFHLDINKNYYLEGYWGNEKYFENVRDLVRQHFAFKKPLDIINENLSRKMSVENSVSVHVRRGDYLSTGSFVDLTKSDYYPDAFHFLNNTSANPVFYIFSNDTEWCRKNFKWLEKYEYYFVEGNKGADSYKDMQLMSVCKRNIIANSTFSWWGGWLNKNPEKIIICPKKFVHNESLNNKILREFYPESWVKI